MHKLGSILCYTTLPYYSISYYTILYYAILGFTVLYNTALYYIMLYWLAAYYKQCGTNNAPHYTIIQHCALYTILDCPILYDAILYLLHTTCPLHCHAAVYYTILYYAVLYYTALCETSLVQVHLNSG